MVNPLKIGQRASNFLKRKQQNQKRKAPETVEFPGFLGILKSQSALAELRSPTGGLQAVLNQFFRLFPVFSRVSSFCLAVFPYELTHQLSRFFFTICAESLVYHRCQFPRLIVLHLGVNVHSHLAVLVPSQILNSLWIDAFMNQIRDIGVPEKMQRHMEIQSISRRRRCRWRMTAA